jgi:hypothetical protein
LNRQAERYAREGVALSLSTLADQVGACTTALQPIHDLIRAHVLAAERLHGDDTTVPLLARGATKQARLWTYVRDDRPFAGGAPPAALFHFSPDREKTHPNTHLAGWHGTLQADAYGGYNDLYRVDRRPALVISALCWSHARRKFFELADIAGNVRKGKPAHEISPVALEAVARIDALFDIERGINGMPAEDRLAARLQHARPLVEELHDWLMAQRGQMSKHNPVAKAINYMFEKEGRWEAFARFLDDGRLCLTNNAAERALRGVAGPESLCTPSLSICKHWKRLGVSNATRAALSGYRGLDGCRSQIAGPDLIRRAGNHLLGRQHVRLDQVAYSVVGHAQNRRRLCHGQPFALFIG